MGSPVRPIEPDAVQDLGDVEALCRQLGGWVPVEIVRKLVEEVIRTSASRRSHALMKCTDPQQQYRAVAVVEGESAASAQPTFGTHAQAPATRSNSRNVDNHEVGGVDELRALICPSLNFVQRPVRGCPAFDQDRLR